MKTGKTLVELAQELTDRAAAKADYVAPAAKIKMVAEADKGAPAVGLHLEGQDVFPMLPYAHGQMAQYLKIPKPYYDRMLSDAPGLLALSANRWLEDCRDEKSGASDRRMVRTLHGQVRALLSDRYRCMENEDLAQAVLPVLADIGVEVVSADVTDTRFYIKAVDKSRQEQIDRAFQEQGLIKGKGHSFIDVISPAITIQNSEVGSGSLQVNTSIWTHACTNLAVWDKDSFKKYHVGRRADMSDDIYALLTDETRRASDEALFLQARDITRGAFEEAAFTARADKLRRALDDEVECETVEVVERVAKKLDLSQGEKGSVLEHLIRGGELNRYGVHAAVTRTAEDVPSYDRASDLEKLGARIIELPDTEWRQIAKAA